MIPSGRLYVFEGNDDKYKSKILKVFCAKLSAKGVPNKLVHISELCNELIKSLMLKESITSSTSLSLLRLAVLNEILEKYIFSPLAQGESIIIDSIGWEGEIYFTVKNKSKVSIFNKYEHKLRQSIWGKLEPSVVFFIRGERPKNRELLEEWTSRNLEYDKLVAKNTSKFVIMKIENEDSISHAIEQITKKGGNTKTFVQSRAVFSSLDPAKISPAFETYWKFAAERQSIFFKRLNGETEFLTTDPILSEFKFTNAYRASDRVSQYLIKNVIYQGDQSIEEVFFRIILFKIFNKIETWEKLLNNFQEITYRDFDFNQYDKVLTNIMDNGEAIYSAAYMMSSGSKAFNVTRKHRAHLMLIEKMMNDELPLYLMDCKNMLEAFKSVRSYPMIGDFLAYQYVTDINYSEITDFSECEFTVPGPGALDGIRKCFHSLGGLSTTDIIKLMYDRQEYEFDRLEIDFKNLWGRELQYIDIQNLFCEVDKYCRVYHPDIKGISGRQKIKQKFKINTKPIEFWYPPKWGINGAIRANIGVF